MTGDHHALLDDRLMGLALAAGRRNLGQTWPNPSVGAVVATEAGRIVAVAATARGGRPHAEPLALAAAGAAARGATLYVSLEPCSHHGGTPPCTDAILASGIARVVTAIEDADPRVAGRGHAILRAAGLAVTTGMRTGEAARHHRGHLTRTRCGRPSVSVKLARTADGFAAREGRVRLVITGEPANARTHMARARSDAILVGIETVIADDPRLDVRLPGLADRSPVRVVMDGSLRTPETANIVRTARDRPTWILCGEAADPEREGALAARGVVVLRVPFGPDGRLDPASALETLAERGLTRVLCEGGPHLAESLAGGDLVDELIVLTSASTLGGSDGVPAFGPTLSALAAGMIPIGHDLVGPDRVEHFERGAACSRAS